MKMFTKRRSVCRALAPSVTTAILMLALSVPNNNLIEQLSAICHNYRSHGCALTVRRTRVLNLREIRREIRFEAGRDDLRTSNYDPE